MSRLELKPVLFNFYICKIAGLECVLNKSQIDFAIANNLIDGPAEKYLVKQKRKVCGKTWKEVG